MKKRRNILNQDVIKTNFGSTTTVCKMFCLHGIHGILSRKVLINQKDLNWCDICGKSTDAVSKALIDKTIDLK